MSPDQRVLLQFTEALLFESLAEHDGPFDPRPGYQKVRFSAGPRRFTCEAHVGAFGRFRILPHSIRPEGSLREASFLELIESLPVPFAARHEIVTELESTVRLFQHALQHKANANRRSLDYEALESALIEGHPYHPCFKSRIGFSEEDQQLYGPEAGRTFRLRWLAVSKHQLWSSFSSPQEGAPVEPSDALQQRDHSPTQEETFWKRELGDNQYGELRSRLERATECPSQYGLLPVHPWQFNRLSTRDDSIGDAFRDLLGCSTFIDLGTAGDSYRASQSLRTLINVSHPEKAHIKLPLDVSVTSSRRVIAPEFVRVAPAISTWLTQIQRAGDPSQSQCILLPEYASACFDPAETPRDGDLAPHLGVIFRQSVSLSLGPGESAVPANALALVEGDGRPFIEPWLQQHGLRPWLCQLLDVMILPVWHLLAHEGLAVEAHMQNVILVLRDGWPVRIALRDFHESLEYVPHFLARPHLRPRLGELHPAYNHAAPNRYHAMSRIEALRELVMDTLFVFGLTELSWLLERFFGFDETDFWSTARNCLRTYAESGVCASRRRARLRANVPMIRAESLLTRRLLGRDQEEFCHFIPNSLFGQTEDSAEEKIERIS